MSFPKHPLSRPAFPSKGRAISLKPVAPHSSQLKKQPAVQILKRPSDLPKNQPPPNLQKVLSNARHTSTPAKPSKTASNTSHYDSTPELETTARRRPCPRQRRNSISVPPLSPPPLNLQTKGGHLSDCSTSRSADHQKSLRAVPSSFQASRVVSCPTSKEQAAELLLQSLLQGSHDDHLVSLSTPVESKEGDTGDLSMASHLLLNLLKPSKFSSTQSSPGLVSSKSVRYYAGPMFRKAPEPSALPLPSFLAE